MYKQQQNSCQAQEQCQDGSDDLKGIAFSPPPPQNIIWRRRVPVKKSVAEPQKTSTLIEYHSGSQKREPPPDTSVFNM